MKFKIGDRVKITHHSDDRVVGKFGEVVGIQEPNQWHRDGSLTVLMDDLRRSSGRSVHHGDFFDDRPLIVYSMLQFAEHENALEKLARL